MRLDSTTLSWLIVGGMVSLLLLWNIRAFFSWIGGTWYEKRENDPKVTEILLRQIGPFVWGEAEVPGGTLRFRGWFNGKEVRLRRRDYGHEYLGNLGFPQDVWPELDGSEMAKMNFRYESKQQTLSGDHFPQKIDLSPPHTRPRRIEGRIYLAPKPRTWTRIRPRHQEVNAS